MQDTTFIPEERRTLRERRIEDTFPHLSTGYCSKLAHTCGLRRRCNGWCNIRVAPFCSLQRVTVLFTTRRYSRASAEVALRRAYFYMSIACTLDKSITPGCIYGKEFLPLHPRTVEFSNCKFYSSLGVNNK